MRVLIVASFNKGSYAPFIVEQAEALKALGCEIGFFGLEGKGLRGYLKNRTLLKQRIVSFQSDIVHAHYGLSGVLANLQRKVPVVVTYHGSDINDPRVRRFSKIAMRLSAWNVFVSKKTLEIASPQKKYTLVPCGIDFADLQLTKKATAREQMHLLANKRYVLFAGAFDNEVKNASLAQQTIAKLRDDNTELIEMKGYSREEVTLLMCAADVLLMTSLTEGSPQVIKEALACGCPIVSVDVGDVRERTEGVEGCFVAETRDSEELSTLLRKAFAFVGKTRGRERLAADGLDNRMVAQKLLEIYKSVCQK